MLGVFEGHGEVGGEWVGGGDGYAECEVVSYEHRCDYRTRGVELSMVCVKGGGHALIPHVSTDPPTGLSPFNRIHIKAEERRGDAQKLQLAFSPLSMPAPKNAGVTE